MSVKVEEIKNTKITAKGILRAIDDEGFHIEDEKSGEVDVLALDDIRELLNRSITIAVTNKEDVD